VEEQSYMLNTAARKIAAQTSAKAEGDALARELGLMDEKGNSQTPQAQEERTQQRTAHVEKLDGLLEQAKTAKEPAPVETGNPSIRSPNPGEPSLGNLKAGLAQDDSYAREIVAAAADAVQAVANGGLKFAQYLNEKVGHIQQLAEAQEFTFAKDLFPKSPTMGNNIVRGAAQFLLPFSAATKAVGLAGVTNVAIKGATAGAAADFMAREGHEENLSDFVQKLPQFGTPVANVMATKAKQITQFTAHSKDDSELLGRIKNMGEGLGLGVLTEGLVHAVGFVGNLRRAKGAVQTADEVAAGAKPLAAVDAETSVAKQAPATEPLSPREALTPVDGTVPDKRVQPNLDKVVAEPNVKTLIGNISEKKRAAFESGLPVVHHAELSGKPLMPLDEVLKLDASKFIEDNSARHSLRVYAANSANVAADAASAILHGDTSEKALAKWLQAEEMATELWYRDSQQGGKLGQALGQRNISVGDELIPGAEGELINLRGGPEAVMEDAKAMAKLSPEEQIKVRERSFFQKSADALLTVRAGNLLAKPATWLKNEVGNSFAIVGHDVSKALAPYFPATKSGNLTEEIKLWAGLRGKDAPKNMSGEGLQTLFAEEARLKAIDPAELKSFADVEKHNKNLAKIQDKIKVAYKSGVAPGEWRTTVASQVSSYVDQVKAGAVSFLDAIGVAHGAAKQEGKTLSQLAQEFEAGGNKTDLIPTISSESLGGGIAMDMFGKLQGLGLDVLNKRDNFMKIVTYFGEVNSAAVRLSKMQGLEGEAADAFVREFTANPPNWVGAVNPVSKADMGVAAEAAYMNTFTNELDDKFTQKLYELLRDDQPFGVKLVATPLKLLFPFVKTNFNIAKRAIDYSPVAPLVGRYQEAIAQGGAAAQMARAQMAVGSSVMMGAVTLAANSGITGAGPNNPNLRKLWLQQGNKPYTVKIGGADVDLNNLGQLAPVMKIAADFVDITPHIGESISAAEMADLGGTAAWIVANHMTPEGLFDNLGGLTEAMKTGDFSRFAGQIGASMVPLTGTAGVINQGVVDGTKRDTSYDPNVEQMRWLQEAVNKVKEKIPSLSSTLPPALNIWGEEINYPPGFGHQTMSPIFGSKLNKNDIVLKEFFKLGDNGVTKNDPEGGEHFLALGMPPRQIEKVIGGIPGIVELSPAEYNHFVELSAGKGLPGAPPLKEQLEKLITSDVYKRLKDESKRLEIKDIIREYRKNAKEFLIMSNKDIQQRLDKSIEMGNNARGFIDGPN
jgi:hypothetical protein